jgi:hypothetical protein
MSAAPTRAGRNTTRRLTRNDIRAPEAAFDIDRVHEPFTADIAQLVHAVRRLLASGPQQASPQSQPPQALPHLHLM